MDTHFLFLVLLLGLSLQVGSLQALTCHQCHRINASGICESGEGVCETRGSQRCYLRKVSQGDKFQYGYQGCGDLCLSMSLFTPNAKVDFICCNDASFCNKF